MAKYRTDPMRTDPELKKIVNMVIRKNRKQNKDIKTSRVTKAMANQYNKYPLILRELMEADLTK